MKERLTLVLLIVLIMSSCKDEDNTTPLIESLGSPSLITLLDNGNLGDSRDLYLTFKNLMNEDQVLNYNLILAKSGTNLEFDITTATSLSQDRMHSIEKGGNAVKKQIESEFKDSDGDDIKNDQSYDAYIFTKSNLENKLSSLSDKISIVLKDQIYFEVKTLESPNYPYMEALSYQDGYIMAPGENNIYKVDVKTGQYEIFDTGLPAPLGGGFDPYDGSYYGSMYGGGYVNKYKSDGTNSVFASGMIGPIGIAIDNNKNVYITNFDGNFISKVTPQGTKTTFVNNEKGLINGPDGLVFAGGSLYSINFYDSRILKINSSGEPSVFTTLPGTITGYITYSDGFFYAPSISERRIYKIDMNGNYSVIGGNGKDGIIDGPGLTASFSEPNGIAISGDTIFVGDKRKIRMLIRHE